MHKLFRLGLIGMLYFLSAWLCSAQIAPVSVNCMASPPYLSRWSDYQTSTMDKISLSLTLNDLQHGFRDVKLRVRLQQDNEVIFQSGDLTVLPTISLTSGISTRLTNQSPELRACFSFNNLVGISMDQYNRPLPEGYYDLSFEVVDAMTNEVLSGPNICMLNFFLGDPPTLNLPEDQASIIASPTPNIFFNWTPALGAGGFPSYHFELVEIWDNEVSPQQAFLASTPLYTTTTLTPSLQYDLNMPSLQVGKRYAWRVQAQVIENGNDIAAFKNDGNSEIHSFVYQMDCKAPQQLLAEIQGMNAAKIHWQGLPSFDGYQVQYRKQSMVRWTSVTTTDDQAALTLLEPNTTYEYQVGGHCMGNFDDQGYIYSDPYTFTTSNSQQSGDTSYQCGVVPQINISNTKPLPSMGVNESFRVGDFPVTVTQVSGSQGSYSGKGYTVVPYLMDTKLSVVFTNIKINTDRQMYDGMVETTYDPDWKNVVSTGEIANLVDGIDGHAADQVDSIKFAILSITQDSVTGRVTVTGTNGEQQIITGATSYQILDLSTDSIYHVASGKTESIGQIAPGGVANTSNTNGVTSGSDGSLRVSSFTDSSIQLTFKPSANERYGFDEVNPSLPTTIKGQYQSVLDAHGKVCYLPYKSVVNGQQDSMDVVISGGSTESNKQLSFMSLKSGRSIDATPTEDGFVLKVKGVSDYGTETIIAYRPHTDSVGGKRDVVGAFNLVSLKGQSISLVLVNAGGVLPQVESLQSYLNGVYRGSGVSFKVVDQMSFPIDSLISGPRIQSGNSDFGFHYTNDQDRVNAGIKKTATYGKYPGAHYIILTNKIASSSSNGFMPKDCQFGYIYDNSNHTIAHELGHGVFELQHPFENTDYNVTKGSTDWLMDYSGGNRLPFMDWVKVNDTKLRVGWFDADSAAENTANTDHDDLDLTAVMGYAKSIGAILGVNSYLVINVLDCGDSILANQSILTNKLTSSITNSEFPPMMMGKPQVTMIHNHVSIVMIVKTDSAKMIRNYQNHSDISVENIDDFVKVVNDKAFLGVLTADSIYDCTDYADNLTCESIHQNTDKYVSDLFTDIYSFLGYNHPKGKPLDVGEAFIFWETQASPDADVSELSKIADRYNKLSSLLFKGKNPKELWSKYGEYFKAAYNAHKSEGNFDSEYFARLDNYIRYLGMRMDELSKLTDDQATALILGTFSDLELEYLPMDLRMKVLDHVTSDKTMAVIRILAPWYISSQPERSNTEAQNGGGDVIGKLNNLIVNGKARENIIIRLTKDIRPAEQKIFLENLRNNHLLKVIDSDLCDQFFQNHYSTFLDIIDNYVLSVNNISEQNDEGQLHILDTLYAQGYFYHIANNGHNDFISATNISNQGSFTLTLKHQVGVQVSPSRSIIGNFDQINPTYVSRTISLNFDQPVALYHNDFLLGVDENKTDTVEFVSALRLRYDLKENATAEKEQAAFMLFDMASLAYGEGEWVMGVKGVRAVLATLNTVSTLSGLIANVGEESIVRRYGKDGKNFTNALNLISCVTSMADISYSGYKSIRNLLNENVKVASTFINEHPNDKQLNALGEEISKLEKELNNAEIVTEDAADLKLFSKDGTFLDKTLENDYESYITRKSREGKPPKARLEWKEAREYWLNDSPIARGNAFNNKAVEERWYEFNEVTLANGKRVDSYVPPTAGREGEIISRKATNLDEIQLSTYEKYLKEMKAKYAPGTKINSTKYREKLQGLSLEGKLILEIPESNKYLPNIQEYIDLAKKYNITLRFRPE